MYVFSTSLWNWKTSKEGKDEKGGVGLIILYMPSDNCSNAHVTELRCLIIGNFRFEKTNTELMPKHTHDFILRMTESYTRDYVPNFENVGSIFITACQFMCPIVHSIPN